MHRRQRSTNLYGLPEAVCTLFSYVFFINNARHFYLSKTLFQFQFFLCTFILGCCAVGSKQDFTLSFVCRFMGKRSFISLCCFVVFFKTLSSISQCNSTQLNILYFSTIFPSFRIFSFNCCCFCCCWYFIHAPTLNFRVLLTTRMATNVIFLYLFFILFYMFLKHHTHTHIQTHTFFVNVYAF